MRPSEADIRREIDSPIDLRPSDLLPATRVQMNVRPGGRGMVEVEVIVDGVYVARTSGRSFGHALMIAGAQMAGLDVLPDIELERRPRRWRIAIERPR